MLILPRIRTKIKCKLLPVVPKKLRGLLKFGINTLSFQPFVSLNSNGRTGADNPHSGMVKMDRLMKNPKLGAVFSSLLLALLSITEQSVIVMDISTFHPYQVLCLALQTQEGRAIPLWIKVFTHPIVQDSQNILILDTLREFQAVVGCSFKLVCDRGFIGEFLIGGFLDLELTFYVRMKKGKHWLVEGKRRCLSHQWVLEQQGVMYGEQLRVVRSSKTLQRQLHAKECWYIITNDLTTHRNAVLQIYYYRFEIEECFKDIKHILNINPLQFKKIHSVEILLWFTLLGIWLIYTIRQLPTTILQFTIHNLHKKLSWIRQFWEWITKEQHQPMYPFPLWKQSFRKEIRCAVT